MECYRVEAWDALQYLFQVKGINNHVLHFAAEFSSRLDFDRLKQAAAFLADGFPLVRCGFDESRARPVWVDRGYPADRMVSLIPAEDPGECVRLFLCREPDLAEGPQIEIGLVRGGKSDTLCVLINHMICDAAGFKDVLYTLASLYAGVGEGGAVRAGSMVRDRSVGQILKKNSLRTRFRIFFSKSRLNPHGDQAFELEGCLSTPFIESRTIPKEQFRVWKAYAESRRASVNDVMLTAFLRVLSRTFGRAAALPCAVDLRRFLPDRRAEGVCNLISNLDCDIGPEVGEDFESTLLKVKQTMDARKTDPGCIRNIALLEMLFTVFPYRTALRLIKKYFSNPPVAFTNIGVLDKDRLSFGGAGMTRAFMTGSVKYAPYFQISLTTFDGEATLCVNLYGTQADRAKISDFLDGFVDELSTGAV